MSTVSSLTVRIGADTSELQTAMGRVSASVRRASAQMARISVGAIAAASVASVKLASDFESSFADVRKTVEATEFQFVRMQEEIRGLSKEIPTSVNELNRLAGVAGQLGVGSDNIVEFTKVIALLGDTTDIAGEQAALSLSRFMNIMGTAQSDISRVGSTIVGLGNNFAAMESEIVDIATSMAAFGNQMGLSESQVLAFSAAIAASGGQTEAASTAFQKTASVMQQAVLEGNENLQTFASVAEVSADKFSEAFRSNAAGAIQMFLQGLANISDRGESTATVLDQLGLADQRLQREFGKLIGNLGQLDSALGQAETEWQKNTALTEEAEKRYNTFNSRVRITMNRLKDLGITIGNEALPPLTRFLDLVDETSVSLSGGLNDGILAVKNALLGLKTVFIDINVLMADLFVNFDDLVWLLSKFDKYTNPLQGHLQNIGNMFRWIGEQVRETEEEIANFGQDADYNFVNEMLGHFEESTDNATGSARELAFTNQQVLDSYNRLKPAIENIPPTAEIFDPSAPKEFNMSLNDIANGFGRLDEGAKLKEMKKDLEEGSGAARFFSHTLADGLENVLFQARSVEDAIKGIVRQLASRALVTGLMSLFTGGASLGGGSFFSNMFSVNDAMITSRGDVVKFHPDDNILAMKDFSGMGGGGMNPTDMRNAFASALQAHTSKLGPDEVWVLNQRGEQLRGRLG